MPIHGKMGKKSGDFPLAHVKRMAHAVKKDKAFDPLEVRRFSANTVVPKPKRIANLIEQTRFIPRCFLARSLIG